MSPKSAKPPLLIHPIDLRRACVAVLLWRCPACGQGPLFRGFAAMHERCGHCGVRFERDPGSFLGPIALAYFVVVAVVLAAGIWMHMTGRLGPGAEWWLSATAIATLLVVYRPVKGFWTWLMYLVGEVEREDEGGPGSR